MAKTNYDTIEEKQGILDRALKLKPTVIGVVATDRGWAVSQPNGTLELLVSFGNLDELLGDSISEVEQVGDPIEVAPEPEAVDTPTPEPEPVVEEVPEQEDTTVTPAKGKPGPKKKAA